MHSESNGRDRLPRYGNTGLRAEELLQAAYDAMNSAPSGWVLSGTDGCIHWANPAFLTMFGYSGLSEVIGMKLAEMFASSRIRKMEDIFHAIDQSEEGEAEFDVVDDEGHSFRVRVSESQVRNDQGKIVGWLAFFIDVTVQKRMETELRDSQQYLRTLSARLVDAQEAERKRVARELHDSIGAGLSALKFSVEHWFDRQTRNGAGGCHPPDRIVENIQQLIEEVRRISQNLHPSILDDLGLATAVRSFCRQIQQNYSGLAIETDVSPDLDAMPERLQLVVYRVVQECVTNAARHGQAKHLRLRLVEEDNRLALDIEDDGIGFDPEAAAGDSEEGGGMGLNNIRERTEIFGGRFFLESKLGVGTVVRCRWPLDR
jgi:PAS domain S-box-containing protein